jgi:hypothetical protein
LVGELIRVPATTDEDAAAKAAEVEHLLDVDDFRDLWADLAAAMARDMVRLAPG